MKRKVVKSNKDGNLRKFSDSCFRSDERLKHHQHPLTNNSSHFALKISSTFFTNIKKGTKNVKLFTREIKFRVVPGWGERRKLMDWNLSRKTINNREMRTDFLCFHDLRPIFYRTKSAINSSKNYSLHSLVAFLKCRFFADPCVFPFNIRIL